MELAEMVSLSRPFIESRASMIHMRVPYMDRDDHIQNGYLALCDAYSRSSDRPLGVFFMRARGGIIDGIRALTHSHTGNDIPDFTALYPDPDYGFVDELIGDIDQARLLPRLYAAIDALPESLHRVIECKYFLGMSNSDVAAKEGITIAGVMWRHRKALNQLREVLDGTR